MSTILIPILYVLAGCALLTGLHHGLAAITEYTRRLYILFALASISVAGHTFFRAGAYSATTVAEYVDMRQWEVAFLCGVFIPFCWFIADLTRIRPVGPRHDLANSYAGPPAPLARGGAGVWWTNGKC